LYLIRHAEKDDKAELTVRGKQSAIELSKTLPLFDHVISSSSSRTKMTAYLLTNREPEIDERASFYMAPQEKSDTLNKVSRERGISLLEASKILKDEEINSGILIKAKELNSLIDEKLSQSNDNSKILIVSHDLSISPAMELRGIPLETIPFLSGYVIDSTGKVSVFNRK
jgi:hypothetical protein